jgi:3,4-dihydroxy 2-butanone 4-phosphate synthase/GTP cyclohydrolase II
MARSWARLWAWAVLALARPTVQLAMPCKPFGRESIVAANEAIREGKMVVVTDDESRENEGDLIMAGEHATAESVGFIVRHSSGVICCSVPEERLQALQLPPMVVNNEDPKGTAFTVSVDYKHGTTTGISGADRAATFRALADPSSQPSDFMRPGHVFPLRYAEGGVRVRDGHTEAALDLCTLAGLRPAGILSEVCNDDGSMSRVPQLISFCEEHGLILTSIVYRPHGPQRPRSRPRVARRRSHRTADAGRPHRVPRGGRGWRMTLS